MIVYRFEDSKGIGPYIGGHFIFNKLSYNKHREKTVSYKMADMYIKKHTKTAQAVSKRSSTYIETHKNKNYIYGCSTKQQLRAYFGGNFKVLFQNGYRIKRYRVPDEEVKDIVIEVAFPIKYHKLRDCCKG